MASISLGNHLGLLTYLLQEMYIERHSRLHNCDGLRLMLLPRLELLFQCSDLHPREKSTDGT